MLQSQGIASCYHVRVSVRDCSKRCMVNGTWSECALATPAIV